VSYFRTHKLAYSWRLGALYGYLGCTRQAFGQAIARLTRLQGRRLRTIQLGHRLQEKVVKDAEIVHSMAHYSWENAYCERLHRTLKQGYLRPARIQSFKELQKVVAKSVYKYNTLKPHVHLPNKRSPIAFINWIKENPKINTYVVDIWTELTHLKTTTLN